MKRNRSREILSVQSASMKRKSDLKLNASISKKLRLSQNNMSGSYEASMVPLITPIDDDEVEKWTNSSFITSQRQKYSIKKDIMKRTPSNMNKRQALIKPSIPQIENSYSVIKENVLIKKEVLSDDEVEEAEECINEIIENSPSTKRRYFTNFPYELPKESYLKTNFDSDENETYLVSSFGFAYKCKVSSDAFNGFKLWHCIDCDGEGMACNAVMRQIGDSYEPMIRPHNHKPNLEVVKRNPFKLQNTISHPLPAFMSTFDKLNIIFTCSHLPPLTFIPGREKCNEFFIFTLPDKQVGLKRNWSRFWDNTGPFEGKNDSAKNLYFVSIGGKMILLTKSQGKFCKSKKVVQPQPNEEDLYVVKCYNRTLKNLKGKSRITWIEQVPTYVNPNSSLLNIAIAEYMGTFPTRYVGRKKIKTEDDSDQGIITINDEYGVDSSEEESQRGLLSQEYYMPQKFLSLLERINVLVSLTELPELKQMPTRIKCNESFIFCLPFKNVTRNRFFDNCGPYNKNKCNVKTNYFLTNPNGVLEHITKNNGMFCKRIENKYIIIDPQPDLEDLFVVKAYYRCLDSDTSCKNLITWVQSIPKFMDQNSPCLQSAMAEYIGTFPTIEQRKSATVHKKNALKRKQKATRLQTDKNSVPGTKAKVDKTGAKWSATLQGMIKEAEEWIKQNKENNPKKKYLKSIDSTKYSFVRESFKETNFDSDETHLVSSFGFEFKCQESSENTNQTMMWHCVGCDSEGETCGAVVRQKGDFYEPKISPHIHYPSLKVIRNNAFKVKEVESQSLDSFMSTFEKFEIILSCSHLPPLTHIPRREKCNEYFVYTLPDRIDGLQRNMGRFWDNSGPYGQSSTSIKTHYYAILGGKLTLINIIQGKFCIGRKVIQPQPKDEDLFILKCFQKYLKNSIGKSRITWITEVPSYVDPNSPILNIAIAEYLGKFPTICAGTKKIKSEDNTLQGVISVINENGADYSEELQSDSMVKTDHNFHMKFLPLLERIKILMSLTELPELKKIPTRTKGNESFLFCLPPRDLAKNRFFDNCGPYDFINSTTKTIYFLTTPDGVLESIVKYDGRFCKRIAKRYDVIDPQPYYKDLFVVKAYYRCLGSDSSCRNLITWLQNIPQFMDQNSPCLQSALAEYSGNFSAITDFEAATVLMNPINFISSSQSGATTFAEEIEPSIPDDLNAIGAECEITIQDMEKEVDSEPLTNFHSSLEKLHLLTSLRECPTLQSIPTRFKCYEYFVFYNKTCTKSKNRFYDSSGPYVTGHISTNYYTTKRNGKFELIHKVEGLFCRRESNVYIALNPQPCRSELYILKTYIRNLKNSPACQNHISWLESIPDYIDQNSPFKHSAIAEYMGSFPVKTNSRMVKHCKSVKATMEEIPELKRPVKSWSSTDYDESKHTCDQSNYSLQIEEGNGKFEEPNFLSLQARMDIFRLCSPINFLPKLPTREKCYEYFLLDFTGVSTKRPALKFSDNCGPYNPETCRTKTAFHSLNDEGIVSFLGGINQKTKCGKGKQFIKECDLPNICKVKYYYRQLLSDPNCKNRITWLESCPNYFSTAGLSVAIVEYIGAFPVLAKDCTSDISNVNINPDLYKEDSEPETEEETEPEIEQESEPEIKQESGPETEEESEPETEEESESEIEQESEPEVEQDSEPEIGRESDQEVESEPEIDQEVESEPEIDQEVESEPEIEEESIQEDEQDSDEEGKSKQVAEHMMDLKSENDFDFEVINDEKFASRGRIYDFLNLHHRMNILLQPNSDKLPILPLRTKENEYFVYDFASSRKLRAKKQKSIFWDNCNLYTASLRSVKTTYVFKLDDDKMTAFRIEDFRPGGRANKMNFGTEDAFVVKTLYRRIGRTSAYRSKISYISEIPALLRHNRHYTYLYDQALAEYIGKFPGSEGLKTDKVKIPFKNRRAKKVLANLSKSVKREVNV